MHIFRFTFLTLACFTITLFAVAQSAQAEARKVVLGAYINDIQAIDLQTHSYVVDLYLWFRWAPDDASDFNPSKSFEFMNAFDPEGHVGGLFDDAPLSQPDGSVYGILRHQGAFSSKFDVSKYPFDHQVLRVEIEDGEMGASDLRYIPDTIPIVVNPDLKLPGYKIGRSALVIKDKPYATTFGDLENPDIAAYSRASLVLEIDRPVVSGAVKLFLPVLLVVLSAVFALLLDPSHVEARVGLAVTSLLALVALQLSSTAGLPEVGYLLLLDKIYLISYSFTLMIVFLVTYASRLDEQGAVQGARGSLKKLAESGPRFSISITSLYLVCLVIVIFVDLNS